MGDQSDPSQPPDPVPQDPSPSYRDTTPADIRRQVAAHQVYKQEAGRRSRGYLCAVLLLGALCLAGTGLLGHRCGMAHGRHPGHWRRPHPGPGGAGRSVSRHGG